MAFTYGVPQSLINRINEIEIDTHYYDIDVIPTPQHVFTYTINEEDNTAIITGLADKTIENIVVPFNIQYDVTTEAKKAKVISLANNCFANSNLKSVVLPNTIHEIPEYCFYNSIELTSISIPRSINTINSGAFYDCRSLGSTFVSYTVNNVGEDIFANCDNLSIICYKDSKIEEYAIENNIPYSLISYTLDKEVTKDSKNLVTSGSIYDAIEKINEKIEINHVSGTLVGGIWNTISLNKLYTMSWEFLNKPYCYTDNGISVDYRIKNKIKTEQSDMFDIYVPVDCNYTLSTIASNNISSNIGDLDYKTVSVQKLS